MSSRQEVFISYRGWPEHRHPLFTQQDATDNLNGTHWSKGLESWSPSLGGPFRGLNTSPLRPYPNRDLLAEAGWYDTTGKKGHLKEYAPSPQEEVSSCLQRSLESEALVSRFTEDDSWPSDCGKVEGTPTATSPWTVTPPEHSEEKAKELEHAQSFDLKDFAYFYDHDGRDHASTHLEGHALPKTPISQPAVTKTAPVLGPSKVWALPPRIRRRKKTKPVGESPPSSKVNPIDKPKPKKRGAFTDKAKKRSTALTRQLKSCIRCRMNRGRCLPNPSFPSGPCLTCQLMTGPTLSKMPCYRYIITEASLYREQKAPWQIFSRRWQSMDIVDISSSDWAPSSRIRTIMVSHLNVPTQFAFQVREFIPTAGDILVDEVTDPVEGTVTKVPLPRFAVADMKATAENMRGFVDGNVHNFIIAMVGRDELLWETYLMAFRQVGLARTKQEQTLLSNTFRLWVVCRMTSSPVYICGEDKLGGTPHPLYDNRVMMPLLMTAQFECINYTTFLRPWSRAVLKQLNDLVLAKKREYWLTIYLTMFVLLHSCAMITKRDEETARQFRIPGKYANPASIREHHCGAQTMLAHFHYINRGVVPFSLPLHTKDGRSDLAKAANLTEEQVSFVRMTAEMVKDSARQSTMRTVREQEDVGHDLYWVSMLYDQEWRPKQNE